MPNERTNCCPIQMLKQSKMPMCCSCSNHHAARTMQGQRCWSKEKLKSVQGGDPQRPRWQRLICGQCTTTFFLLNMTTWPIKIQPFFLKNYSCRLSKKQIYLAMLTWTLHPKKNFIISKKIAHKLDHCATRNCFFKDTTRNYCYSNCIHEHA